MTNAEFPLMKDQLMKDFGYLSFQLALVNVDIIGIRILKSYETVIITFRGAHKTGFIYEGGNLKPSQVLRVFQDVPEDRNQLPEYEKSLGDKVEILLPPKDNYVFINEREITNFKNFKKTTL